MTIHTTTLLETRAADREAMAKQLQLLIGECGATYEREAAQRAIFLHISAPGGLCLTMDLDGDSPQPNVYLLSWHMSHTSERRLNDATFGGNVNPHHRRKATYLAHGFEDLKVQLSRGLKMAADGSAYLPELAVA